MAVSSAKSAAKGWTARKQKLFLACLAESANVSCAADCADMSRQSAYRLRQTSPAFRQAWDQAMDTALDGLEAALLRRARDGIEKPVFFGGKECGKVRQYSDGLAMFLLKAHRPERYGEMTDVRDAAQAANADEARQIIAARLSRLAEVTARESPKESDLTQGEGLDH